MEQTNKRTVSVALAGNPNVGKSTLFNTLTGMNQHTGNWPGKTVGSAVGRFSYKDAEFTLTDLPGTYSLISTSTDEEIARDFICSDEPDVTVAVADACCLERNLSLILQIRSITPNMILCVNLLDEAKKKKIDVDLAKLSEILGIPVVGTAARSKCGLDEFRECLYSFKPRGDSLSPEESSEGASSPEERKKLILESNPEDFIAKAKEIYGECVTEKSEHTHLRDRRIDNIVTSKLFGFPIMIGLLGIVFFLTITGANYPSQLLANMFSLLGARFDTFCTYINMPESLHSALMDGIYRTLSNVISVMLPPMAIFFPLFTLLEDFGYLPRIAFNMDRAFRRAHACGKQCLTMMMGFGCNACGVTGCRIIDSPRERLIAILTNSFVPCNGRFPTLIAIITMFFSFGGSSSLVSALILTAVIVLGIVMTLLMSRFLSSTVLKGMPSSFVLELPPYRRPRVGDVIVRSVLDRTIFVLGRAVAVAAPAGLLIWIVANCYIGGQSILSYCTEFLDPFGRLIGVDGVIIMAFILGFPANEIVIPIILMTYMAQGTLTDYSSLTELHTLLAENGWTNITALCTMLLCLLHFPCGTTCLTIKKETGSLKWTALAFLLPTLCGILLCFIVNSAYLLIV